MLKKMNKKGFTLAELLIVVAIIAVLVAISIPILTSQLEKAREATDLANIRAAYAEASAAAVAGTTDDAKVTVTGTGDSASYAVTTDPAQSTGAFDKVENNIKWVTLPNNVTKGTPFTVTVTAKGTVTVTQAAASGSGN